MALEPIDSGRVGKNHREGIGCGGRSTRGKRETMGGADDIGVSRCVFWFRDTGRRVEGARSVGQREQIRMCVR